MNRSLLYPRATTTRRLIGLDGMWRFSFDPESKGVEAGWALDLPSSLSMPVPASFCDLFTDKASREYCGDFWYETSFFVPAEWSGWDIVLRFGSVTHRARVFVNGVEVAQHEGGFLPFDATVTNIVRYNQFNKLSVLANNELSETMLPAGTTRTLADGRKIAAPYFDFYNYAGIHRPVWLMALPKERVLDYSTRYRLTETGAEIDYTVSTNGPHPVTVELYDGTTGWPKAPAPPARWWSKTPSCGMSTPPISTIWSSASTRAARWWTSIWTGSASAPLRSGTGVSCSTAARSICGASAGTRMPTSGAAGSTCPPSSGISS